LGKTVWSAILLSSVSTSASQEIHACSLTGLAFATSVQTDITVDADIE
jgi:hypothetical protein